MHFLRSLLPFCLSLVASLAFAQRGLIIDPANNASVLDPNGDGYVSLDNTGFSNDGWYIDEFEIPMFALPVFGDGDTLNDTQAGPNCGTTDLTVDSTGASAYAALDENNNLIIRMRLADESPSVEAFTILIDTDGKIGAGKDPNYNSVNPGFEIDITLIKSNSKGINVYNIDGANGCPTPDLQYALADNFQIAIADEVSCGDEDYFYDFFVPFGDLTAEYGIDINSELQFVVVTNISGTCAMAGKISDIGGVDDNDYGGCFDCAIDDLASEQCPVPFSELQDGGGGFASGSTPEPELEIPLKQGDAVITGKADPAAEVYIDVYDINDVLVESDTSQVSVDSLWSVSLSAPLNQGDSVVAVAQIEGNCDSQASGSQVSFAVVVLNTKPVINGTVGDLAYTENDGAVPADPGVIASDNEDLDFVHATIQIISGYESGEDALTFTDQLGITGSYDAGTATMTLTGDATVADYNTALQSVTYLNSSEDPIASTRTVEFIINDGTEDSDPFTRDIVVSAVNDAPVLSGTSGSTEYTLETPPFVVNATFSITDADDTQLSSAAVNIVQSSDSSFVDGDELTFTAPIGITGMYNTGTGVLTFTGLASLADYASALNSVSYEYNPPGAVNENTRRIEYSVNDGALGSDTINHFITFDPAVNFPPDIVDENGDPVVDGIDIVTNEDSTVEICLAVNDPDGDLVTIDNITAATNGTISQTGDLCFEYAPDANFDGTETVTVTVCDALGACDATPVDITIEVTPINDAPILAPSTTSVDEKILTQLCIDPTDITDVEGDTHEFVSGTSSNGGTVADGTANDLCFDYIPPTNFIGTDQVEVTICDSNDPAVCTTSTIDVEVVSVNENPIIYVNGISSASMTVQSFEDSVEVFCFAVIDVDGDEVTTVAINNISGNGTLIADATEFCYEYSPIANEHGTSSVWEIVIQDDDIALPLTDTVRLTINLVPVNDPPTLDAILDPTAIDEDAPEQTVNLTGITAGINETQVLNVTAVSDNLSLVPDPLVNYTSDASNGSLSYTPQPNQFGNAIITVTVDDGEATDSVIVQTFTVTVNPINDAPSPTTDTLMVNRKGSKDFQIESINVLENDMDIENDQLLLDVQLVETPSGGTATLSSDGTITYESEITFRGIDQLKYSVYDNGSPSESSIGTLVIVVNDGPFTVYQTVSPDGDDRNDYWHIEGIDFYPNNTVELYDRYNNLVFSMKGYNNADRVWRGTSSTNGNKLLPEGTYFYRISVGELGTFGGFVVLRGVQD